jgi:hypothetical protein
VGKKLHALRGGVDKSVTGKEQKGEKRKKRAGGGHGSGKHVIIKCYPMTAALRQLKVCIN